MNILDYLQNHYLILDGAMGTILQKKGLLPPGAQPERLNLTSPNDIRDVHLSYFDAGSNLVCTNTFGANLFKYTEQELREIIPAAIRNARDAAALSTGAQQKFIALDVGPTGRMLSPFGDLDFEEAVSVFAVTIRIASACGVDAVLIETMSDLYETKAALLAAKENCDLPVFVSNAFGADGKLLTGASPEVTVAVLEGLGADAVGVNCSLGPDALRPVVDAYLRAASVPVLVKPNAGLPVERDGDVIYDVSPASFCDSLSAMAQGGARLLGGCCGTDPSYIRALAAALSSLTPVKNPLPQQTVVASYTGLRRFGDVPLLIGERINPTGKKRFQQALREHDLPYLLEEAVSQQENGAHILDVNVGLPDIDEPSLLEEAVTAIQSVCDLPLQIDTADPAAMERALRRYNGKALINSVNGKEESMRAVFPLAKKYGGVIVALTLDENGIPDTAEERVAIARRILSAALACGIQKKDLVFDPLCMSVSASPSAAAVTLESIRRIRSELGCHTVIGLSNVSFGLPDRGALNASMLTLAIHDGLSAAIMNPKSEDLMRAYRAALALLQMDPDFALYLAAAPVPGKEAAPAGAELLDLISAVKKGMKDAAAKAALAGLASQDGLSIINTQIIPALNDVGAAFENKTLFLPQLLMSAEAAAAAFEVIKAHTPAASARPRCRVVLLTVKGDVHDIGKNIVRLLLENFGFAVTDLGKDVSPEDALRAVVSLHAPLVGLSALMTTTVPAMRDTVKLIHREAPWCRVIVGGAVLTEEYAAMIGADHYAPDAMETVRYASEIDELINKEDPA